MSNQRLSCMRLKEAQGKNFVATENKTINYRYKNQRE